MVIDDFDRLRALFAPHETNSPLIIDPDAVLASAVRRQGFQPVARYPRQVVQGRRGLETCQTSSRLILKRPESPNGDAPAQVFSVAAPKGTDHYA